MNPSDRLISQKITVQSTFHEASACTWGTSTNLVFPYSQNCASKLREGMEMMVRVPPSFLVAYFWVQQGSLLFDRNKTDRQTNAKLTLDPYQV